MSDLAPKSFYFSLSFFLFIFFFGDGGKNSISANGFAFKNFKATIFLFLWVQIVAAQILPSKNSFLPTCFEIKNKGAEKRKSGKSAHGFCFNDFVSSFDIEYERVIDVAMEKAGELCVFL